MKRLIFITLCSSFALLTSCVTKPPEPIAKNIEMEPGKSGVIMISPSDDPLAHQKAETLMQKNCAAKKYQILKEGDVKVGVSSIGSSHNKNENPGFLDSLSGITAKSDAQTNSATTDITEWRINYLCK